MTKPKRDQALEEIRDRVRRAGLRRTPARIAVLRALRAAHAPLSHADVAARLARRGFDKATVYRNLVELSEAGLLGRFELGDHVWRFEWRGEPGASADEHPHFLCEDCGEISCLTGVTVRITPSPGSRRSSMRAVTHVLLKGHCGRCA